MGKAVFSISHEVALAAESGRAPLPLPRAHCDTDSLVFNGRSLRREHRVRALVQANYDFVYRTLRRLGLCQPDAEDASQEVFLVACGRLERILPDSERPFLIGTALRVAARKRRSIARRRESFCLGPVEGRPDHHLDPEQVADQKSAQEAITEVLSCMSPELQVVFILFEIEEAPMSEIAQALDLPPGTVASRLRRARAAFRNALRHRHLQDTFHLRAAR